MKEKLHFIEGENQQLEQQLQQLEAALAGSRDELAGLKVTRDKMRQQGRQLKENSVYVSNPMLLQDMQVMHGAVWLSAGIDTGC
jgi:chromosome segregation ATPase